MTRSSRCRSCIARTRSPVTANHPHPDRSPPMSTTGFATPSNRVLVLFGATGDLAARKLLPGLFHLFPVGLMPAHFRIVGPGRHAPDDFNAVVEEALRTHGRMELDGHWQAFSERLSFVTSSAED